MVCSKGWWGGFDSTLCNISACEINSAKKPFRPITRISLITGIPKVFKHKYYTLGCMPSIIGLRGSKNPAVPLP